MTDTDHTPEEMRAMAAAHRQADIDAIADAEERDHTDPDDAALGRVARSAIDAVLTDGAMRSAHYLTIDGKPVRLIVRPAGPDDDDNDYDPS